MGPEVDRKKEAEFPLQMAADEEVRRTGLRLRFAPQLEQRYRLDTAAARAFDLPRVAYVGMALFMVTGLLWNLFLDPNPRWKLTAVVWGLMIAAALIVQPYFRPAISFRKRESAILGFYGFMCLAVMAFVDYQPTPLSLEPLIFTALPIYFVLIFVRLPFPLAILFMVVSEGAYGAILLQHPELSETGRMFLVGFLLALTLPTLVAAHHMERASRRLYLHGLLQHLNYERVMAHNAVLTDLSYTDPLTGIANRRRMTGELQRLCDKEDTCSTFLIVDIDWFKNFNDLYGHPVGDRCLQEVATCLAAALRGPDLLARLGGEEFGVLLPELPMQEAVLVAERLRAGVAAYPFMVGTRIVRITVSVGVASIVGFDEPARVMDAADKALYRAKRSGRNRVGGPWVKLASNTDSA
jgi:diguanylate cyclase (GGDEF)-like protein